jgi:multicomponent K+:H+ antiporter subunit F
MILSMAISITAGLLLLAIVFNMIRLGLGPSTLDRVVALDTMYVNAIGLIVLMGIHQNSHIAFEAALLIAMMGFVGTVALGKYYLRGDIIE